MKLSKMPAGILLVLILFVLVYFFYPVLNDFYFDHFQFREGDIVGMIQIVQDDGSVVSVRTGGDKIDYFGSQVKASDLLNKFDHSIAAFRGYDDPWRNKRYWREEYKLDMAVDLLIKSKNPNMFERFTKLLNDPVFTTFAIEKLIDMRDPKACPFILASWNDANKHNDMFVVAFRTFPYKPAVPKIIDSIRESYEDEDMDFVLVTIEKITDKSLESFRYMRHASPDEVRELKANLLSWWKQYGSDPTASKAVEESNSTTFDNLDQALAFIDQRLDQNDWSGLEAALYPPLTNNEQSRTQWQQLKSDRSQGRLEDIFKDLHFPRDEETYGYPYNKDVFAFGASNNAESRLKGVSHITFLKTDAGWRLKSVSSN